MPCKLINIPGGGMAIACSRGRRESCSSPGCNHEVVALCDYPLTGARMGDACSRPLCDRHRVAFGKLDYCLTHGSLAVHAVAVIGSRTYPALHLVMETVRTLPDQAGVVSGHAIGSDIVAEITAAQGRRYVWSYPVRVTRNASKDAFTRAAMARNTVVAAVAREADAFVDPQSRGTWDTIRKLEGLSKKVRVHEAPPPADHALLFHTGVLATSMQVERARTYRGPSVLNITANVDSPFSPSRALLNEALSRVDSVGRAEAFAWYEPRYIEEQRAGWKQHRAAWDEVLQRNHFVAACFCSDPATCHRGIFRRLLVKAGEKVGRRVVDGGEVTP